MNAAKIQLAMTDRPRPPQPPGNDDLEAQREIVEHGMAGLGQRFGNALRGVLDGPAQNPAIQQVPPKQQGQPRPAQPQPANKPQEAAPATPKSQPEK
jgi:hypothetical protein